MDLTHRKNVSRRRPGAGHLLGALGMLGMATSAPPVAFGQGPIDGRLRSVLRELPHPQAKVGACVIDLATGGIVFAENADAPLTPASTMKVFVMAAGLARLGPDFTFHTVLARDGTNLVVIGDGDPSLGDEKVHRGRNESITADFDRWAAALLARGDRVIPGDLVIDEAIFDAERIHPDWEPADLGKWYAAPVGGLNFNGNCLDITASPGSKAGAPAIITVQPPTSLIEIVNKCRTGGRGEPVVHHPAGTFQYVISGACSKRWPFVSVSFPDPGLLFADSLRTVLRRHGVTVSGTIQRRRVQAGGGRLPGTLTVVERRDTPLLEIMPRIGKNSQNMFAECLLKRVGYADEAGRGATDPQGSWRSGGRAIMSFVSEQGIATEGLAVADGSGLSRNNRCTARQLTSLLARMNAQPAGRFLRENLSIAGDDGSLDRRLTDIAGRIQAKTGTMHGVCALTGYVDGDAGPRYAFAVMFNGYPGPSTPYKRLQDQFCRILAEAGGR